MKSPFKFLDSFTKEDREIFFGREKEIEELYQRIFKSKIMLVYGVSGTGKSSLINCGLANKFHDEDWLPLNIRRGKNILESMYASILAASLTPKSQYSASEIQFRKYAKSLYLDHYKPIYFIFDQFEELFIFGTKEEKSLFVRVIKTLIDSDILCRFIFVMREEYMANVTEFEKHIPVFFSNRVRIENMDINNAIQAIKGPCKVSDISVEEGFPEALIENLSPGSPDIELTYLQVFLDKIFRLATTKGGVEFAGSESNESVSFTIDQLQKVGNVSDLLGTFLNEQISLLDDPDSALAVLKSFVSIKGTKRQMTLDDVKEYAQTLGKPIKESVLLEMLQNFVNLRILRDKDQNDRYELRHDSLATKIYEKISGVEKDILEIRQFIEDGYHNWQKRGVLLSANDLEYIAPYESRLYLSQDHLNYITQSKNQLEKVKKKRRAIFVASGVVLLIVFAGFTIWALSEKQKSNQNYISARANSYNFLSQKVVETDPTIALRLAEYARSIDSINPDVIENINRIYYDNNFYRIVSKNENRFSSITFSPNGKSILTNKYVEISLLDLRGNVLQVFKGHEKVITSEAFSPDGKSILTGSNDKTARLWDLQGNVLQVFKGHLNGITSVAFSPDGKTILTGSYDKTACLWDLNGNVLKVFRGHEKGINSIAFSPDGKTILTGSDDNTARLWDLQGNVLKVFKGHEYEYGIESVAFSPDGKSILTYSSYIVRLLNLDGNVLHLWKGLENSIYSMSLSPDGKSLLLGYSDKSACIWDMQGNLKLRLKGHKDGVNCVAFSQDSKMAITASFDGQINLWKLEGSGIKIIRSNDITSVRFSPDREKILTGSYDSTARILDLEGNILQIFKGHSGPVFSVAFSPDRKSILTGSFDKTAILWDLQGNILQVCKGHLKGIMAVAFSPDGKSLLTGSDDNTARLWDLQGNVLKVFKGHFNGITAVAFSPDGKSILTGSNDETVRLWDLQGNKLMVFKGTQQECYSVAFSPDGRSVLTGSGNNTVRLWDLNGNLLQVFKGSYGEISAVAFSPDGKIVLASSYDFIVHLWDLKGNELQIFKGHESDIYSIAFSPDGKSFVSGSKDGTLRVCEIKKNLKNFQNEDAYEKLSFSQKIRYGILDISDILKLNNKKSIYEAAEYYYKERNLVGKEREIEYRNNAEMLFQKGLTFDTLHGPIARRLTELCIENNQLYLENVDKEVDKYFNLLLKTADLNDLIISLSFYITRTDSSTILYKYSDKAISIGQKLLDLSLSDRVIRSQLSYNCSNLSWSSILCRQYKNSLLAVKIAIKADSTNQYSYTNLPIAYLLNNMYNEAEKEYIKWKDKPWTADSQNKNFRELFLTDLADLENVGINHPDFERVKELLKK